MSDELNNNAATEPKPAKGFIAIGDTVQEFAVSIAKALLNAGVMFEAKSDSEKNPTEYLHYTLGGIGNPSADFRATQTLSYQEATELPGRMGLPMAMSFKVALLDLTPKNAWASKRAERQAATAVRDIKRVSSLSDDVLEAEIARRRAQNGK